MYKHTYSPLFSAKKKSLFLNFYLTCFQLLFEFVFYTLHKHFIILVNRKENRKAKNQTKT